MSTPSPKPPQDPPQRALPPKPKRTSAIPGVVVLAVLCFLLFALLVLVLYQNGMLALPEFLSALIGQPQSEDPHVRSDFSAAFLGAVDDGEPERTVGEMFTIDRETLTEYVAAGGTENYYHELIVTYFSGETVSVRQVSIFRAGDKFKINTVRDDTSVKTVVCDGSRLLLQHTVDEQTTQKVLPFSEAAAFSLYSEAGIPSVQTLFALLDDADAGTIIADYAIELLREADRNAARVTFTYPDTGITEIYEIDLESALLVKAESLLADTVYYTMTTSNLTPDLLSGTGLFQIP